MYRITAVEIRDFQRIQEVRIEPDADASLILIAGPNAQGKTSILNAMSCALGGAKELPPEPVRRGADGAEIILELDGRGADCNGPLVVRRRVTPDGETTFEVREDGVKVRGPQSVLDRLKRGRFLDPLTFLAKKPGDQRAALLAVVGNADRLEELDRKRQRAFDKRTELNRELKRAEGELARTVAVTPADPIDAAALTLESQKLERAGADVAQAQAEAVAAARESEHAAAAVAGARDAVAAAEEALSSARLRLVTAETRAGLFQESAVAAAERSHRMAGERAGDAQRSQEILFELRRAQAHNDKVAADRAQVARRAALVGEIETLRASVDGTEQGMAEIDRRKAEILDGSNLPVPGLGIDENGVTYQGHPLEQASGAERHRVALGIAMAAAPELGDVWIRDGSLLDDDSLAAVVAAAEAAGVRVWIERVGTRDDGAIVIRDGRIAS